MKSKMDQANALYQQGFEIKEGARKSNEFLDKYQEASDCFEKAAQLCKEIIDSQSSTYEEKIQAEIFYHYYTSEKYSSMFSYFYGNRLIEDSKNNQKLSIEHIQKALALINDNIDKVSEGLKMHLDSFKAPWKFMLKAKEVDQYGPDARRYWDKGNLIQALDLYRKMIPLYKGLIEFAREMPDPSFERISIGNYIGMLANQSSALSRIFLEKATNTTPKQIKENDAIELIRHNLEAVRLARTAYENNPEWEEYKRGAEIMEENVFHLLQDNPKLWIPMLIAFENDKEVLSFMKKVDIKKYHEAEAKVFFRDNKIGKLLKISSVWVVLFLIISATVIFISSRGFPWWLLIISYVFILTLFVTIGAFSLRAVGDLSEENFLTLIKMTLSNHINQLKLLFNGNGNNHK